MVLGHANTLKAQAGGEDYFPGDYVFGMDMASLYPEASIYSSMYWYNLAGTGSPALIYFHTNYSAAPESLNTIISVDLMGIWSNGSTVIIGE